MTTERKEYYVRLVERLGISTVILGFVGWGMYGMACWIGPRADKMLDKHSEVVDAAVELGKRAMDISQTNSETLERVGVAQEKQTEILSEIHRVVVPQPFKAAGSAKTSETERNN